MAKQSFTTGQVLTAAQVNSLQANDFNQTVSPKTASYVLVASDKGTRIEFNTSGSVTCTVNTGLFDAGDTVYIQNRGAGVVTITAGTATVNTSASLALNQWEGGVLYFISASASVWYEYASNANGDITGITTGATSGLTGGVTSGTADLKLNVTAKGDLLVGTGSGAVSALAVATEGGSTLVADSSATTGLRYNPPVGSLANPVINGGFDIWQRGTSQAVTSTSTSFYGPDRWQIYRAATGSTVSRQTVSDTTNLPNIQYSMRLQRDSGNTSTVNINAANNFESVNSIPFAGKAITLSFYARAGANFSGTSMDALLYSGTGTDQNVISNYTGAVVVAYNAPTLTTTWTRYVATGTVPTNANEIALLFRWSPTGTAGANDWVEITGIQIDVGTWTASTVPTFRRSGGTLAGELQAAQRYYQIVGGGSCGRAASTSVAEFAICYKVTTRGTPSLSLTTTTPQIYDPAVGSKTATGSTLTQVVSPTVSGDIISISGFTGLTSGGTMFTHQTDFVIVSAEL